MSEHLDSLRADQAAIRAAAAVLPKDHALHVLLMAIAEKYDVIGLLLEGGMPDKIVHLALHAVHERSGVDAAVWDQLPTVIAMVCVHWAVFGDIGDIAFGAEQLLRDSAGGGSRG